MSPLPRRHFLRLGAASLFAAPLARAIEPLARAGSPRLQLSLAAYSFRESFKDQKGKPTNPDGKLDMLGFIDYCADHGCAGAELTSYFFPKDVTEEYLLKVRRHAFLRGVAISGTSVGNNFALPVGPARDKEIADVKKWIDYAAILGAPHIRIFAGAAKGISDADARAMCISAIEECCAYAGTKGIFLGLENHGGIVAKAEGMLEIIKAVKSPWFGVNLDTGNFHSEDPYAEMALIAPYAVNLQVKAEILRAGSKTPELSDLPKVVKILRDANYQGWVALEYEAKEDPWTAVPRWLGELGGQLTGAPAKTADAAWVPLFDGKTLEGWTFPKFSGQGEVLVEGGKMMLYQGNDLTGINYAKEVPRMNYEVSLEAMRVLGSDFFCGFTFPYGENACTFVIGGWGGGLVGLSSINGDDASENETMQARKFDNGRWYKIRVRVTPTKIEGWIDDDQVLNVETQGKKISMRPGEIELSAPFGLATFRTQAAVREIKLRRF
ncbi:MAG: TIM barrel protein [Chthoniobacteraceae bacterium]